MEPNENEGKYNENHYLMTNGQTVILATETGMKYGYEVQPSHRGRALSCDREWGPEDDALMKKIWIGSGIFVGLVLVAIIVLVVTQSD